MGSYVPVKEMSVNDVEVLNFFQAFLRHCINCVHTATITSSFSFHFRSSYMIYFIYH